MGDVVIDTDVASVMQKGRAPAWVARRVAGQRVWLTFVTVGELWKWAEARSWGTASRDRLAAWVARRRGRPHPQNDTWVAACSIRHGVPLITLNAKDFEDFAEHDGLVLLSE